MRHVVLLSILSLTIHLSACGSDDGEATGRPQTLDDGGTGADVGSGDGGDDAGTVGDASTGDDSVERGGGSGVDVFAFAITPGQPMSAAPFPNDVLLDEDGLIRVGKLGDDPRVSAASSKPELLKRYDGYIAARRGFSITAPMWLFASEAIDMDSLEGHVHLIGLAGREAGAVVPVQVFWNDDVSAVGVLPAFGHYLVGGTTYGITVDAGVETAAGEKIAAPAALQELIDGTGSGQEYERAKAIYDPLFAAAADPLVLGVVFTTENVLPYGQAVIEAAAGYELSPPTRTVAWNHDTLEETEAPVLGEADLDEYFGVPKAPFEYNPGRWGWNRGNAELLPGYEKFYDGGTFHADIGTVLHGTIEVPVMNFDIVDGEPLNTAIEWNGGVPKIKHKSMVPFTIFLCKSQLADPTNLPVAIFNHGGGALRSDALGFANANCKNGVATAAIDMLFHSGRLSTRWHADRAAIVPTRGDGKNDYTSQPGKDYIGDPLNSAASVAPLFAIGHDADPLMIEANLLAVTTDSYLLVRYLGEGDWSQVLDGLSFDSDRIFHQSLSFGSSFTTALMALHDFAGIISSVGTGRVLMNNLPMAPSNSSQAAGLIVVTLGLPTLPEEFKTGSYRDFMMAIHGWLHERGDALAWAPHVQRYRATDAVPPILSSGNSWDETLFAPDQITYANAIGMKTYTHGPEWTIDATIPGAESLNASPAPDDGIAGNVSFDGKTTTSGIFFRDRSCHAQVVTALCAELFEHPYPPIVELEQRIISHSPICALHGQIVVFMKSILEGAEHAIVSLPTATCEELYGP